MSREVLNSMSQGREYSEEEDELLRAMARYQTRYKRPFPTCCEVLAVLQSLGYRKVAPPTALPRFLRSAAPTGPREADAEEPTT